MVDPSRITRDMSFSEADLARANLIRDLTQDLGVNDEGVGVILSLVDQVHGLRKALAEVLRSMDTRSAADAGSSRGEMGPPLDPCLPRGDLRFRSAS